MINVEGAWHIMFKPRSDGRRNKHCVKFSSPQVTRQWGVLIYCLYVNTKCGIYSIFNCTTLLYFIFGGSLNWPPFSRKNTILKKKPFYKLWLPLSIGELSHGDEVFHSVIFYSRISIFLLNMIVHVWTMAIIKVSERSISACWSDGKICPSFCCFILVALVTTQVSKLSASSSSGLTYITGSLVIIGSTTTLILAISSSCNNDAPSTWRFGQILP